MTQDSYRIDMSKYDAVAVFGSQINSSGQFPPFVYQAIDRAIQLLEAGAASKLIFCGSHAFKMGQPSKKKVECEIAETYIREHYPQYIERFLKECESTSVVENWLYLRARFGPYRRIHLITIDPLLPRMKYVGDWMYGGYGRLSFETVPGFGDMFPDDARVLRNTKCILTVRNNMPRGRYQYLLKNGRSIWQELRIEHRENCPLHT